MGIESIPTPESEHQNSLLPEMLTAWGFNFEMLDEPLGAIESILQNAQEGEAPSQAAIRLLSEAFKSSGTQDALYLEIRNHLDTSIAEAVKSLGVDFIEQDILSQLAMAAYLEKVGNFSMMLDVLEDALSSAHESSHTNLVDQIERAWPQ